MSFGSSKHRFLILFAPLGWGALSYFIFSIIKPKFSVTQLGAVPLWMWLWLLQMFVVIPFWIWISKQGFERAQRNSVRIFKFEFYLGKPRFYLFVAYLAAISALPLSDTWFGKWLVFGGIVSPIFEELFSRNLLTPWFEKSWVSYAIASIASSAAFALMHWGFNNAEALALTPQEQVLKFISHFIFALVLCLVFRVTKSIQFVIWLHIASNLQFILTKL